MKEITIISGKGGTGKTSIAASFAALAHGKAVLADCDVDAADLHLILTPHIVTRNVFISGHEAVIRKDECNGCGKCFEVCRFGAVVHKAASVTFTIDPVSCEGCGVCVRICPTQAIDFPETQCGEWFISKTRFGTMVHAKLGIAAENSGRLVTLVRSEAKRCAEEQQADYVIIDGSPGIGCPVIASLTSSDLALIVTEPTVSGVHDLERIGHLAQQLRVPAMVCVNKWDINPDVTEAIRLSAQKHGLGFAGVVRYDATATRAQREAKTILEYPESGIAEDIRQIWHNVLSVK